MESLTTHRQRAAAERMRSAKAKFSEAAVATLRGDSDAPVLCRIALSQLEQARAELRRLGALETP